MVRGDIPLSINKETVRRVLWKAGLKWIHGQKKGILTKNVLKLRLKFDRKVRCKRAVCNYKMWNQQKTYGTTDIIS